MYTFNTGEVNNFVSRYKALTAPPPVVPQPNPAIGGAITRDGRIDNSVAGGASSFVEPTKKTTDRTKGIGLLDEAKNSAIVTAEQQADIQRQADQYAAQQRQARIDAINTTFAPRFAKEAEEGKARLERVKALNFNAGIVGSGVDTTKTGEQKDLNDKALQALQDEKAILINDAFNVADKLATDRATLLTTQSKDRAESNVKLYQEQADKAVEVLKAFGKVGKKLDEIETADPNTMKTLREVSGLSDLQIASILDSSSPTPTNVDTKIENGYLVASYYDPLTKKFKSYTEKLDLPATADKASLEIVKGENGFIYVMDKAQGGKVINTVDAAEPNSNGEDPEVMTELQQAQAAYEAGAPLDAVRRKFLDKFPKKGDLFLKYTKQAY